METAEFYLQISVLVWALGILLFVGCMMLEKWRGEKWNLNPSVWLVMGTVGAIFLIYFHGNLDAVNGKTETFLLAVLGSIRVLAGENAIEDTLEQFPENVGDVIPAATLYMALLHVTVSSVVITYVFKLVNRLFPKIKYRFWGRGRMYIFSGASEREILLAEDIRRLEKEKKGKATVIVFLWSGEEGQQVSGALRERIRKLNGYLFDDSLLELYIPLLCRRSRRDYFLLKEQDGQNINDALELAEKYKTRGNSVYVHVMSDYPETESLLDSVSNKENCNFRLIPETRTMLYQLLSQSPLFMGVRENKLDILIVGAGRNGQEAVKACSWCGCLLDIVPEIWVIDQSEQPLKQLLKDCPEIMQQHVHYEVVDVCTPRFYDFLREHREIGYVICALGEEHLNLRTAMEIRSVFYEEPPYDKKAKELPIINVLLNDDVLHHMAQTLKYDKDTSCELHPFGNLKEFYNWGNIGASYLEGGGLAVHGFYQKLFNCRMTEQELYEDYEASEYNRSSSIATALHGKYKVYSCWEEIERVYLEKLRKKLEEENDKTDKNAEKRKAELREVIRREEALVIDWSGNPDEEMCSKLAVYLYDTSISVEERKARIEKLAELEHARWNSFTRSRGWRTADKDKAKLWKKELGSKNVAAKLHSKLVEWEELDFETQEYDRNMIWRLPFILYEALHYDDLLMGEKRKMRTTRTDMGIYSDLDFEAIVYWYDNPITPGEEILIEGKKDKVSAYLRQALLLNIMTVRGEKLPKYVICCEADLEEEFADVIARIGEQVSFRKCRGEKYDNLIITRKVISKEGKTEEGIREEIKVNKQRVKEMKAELVRKGKAFNDYYRSKFGGNGWEELEPHKKASNICAAAYIERHREAFMNGDDMEMIAKTEHERWCRFHYVNGWKYGAQRDDSKKIHNCLIPFEELDEDNQEKDRRNIEIGLKML